MHANARKQRLQSTGITQALRTSPEIDSALPAAHSGVAVCWQCMLYLLIDMTEKTCHCRVSMTGRGCLIPQTLLLQVAQYQMTASGQSS